MNVYTGIVQKGTKRAAALGFPTLNIPLDGAEVSGIYAARVSVGGEEYLAAVFADPERKVLEAHLLDFSPRALYGEEVSIELCKKIRESEVFDDNEKLYAAITHDIEKVRDYFAPPEHFE